MSRRRLPGLLLLALLVAAGETKSAPNPPPRTDEKAVAGTNPPLSADEKTILDLTNKAREEKSLPPLTLNPVLTKVARAHSANQAKQEKMAHVLDGKNPADRVKEAGYKYSWVGENVAKGENVTVRQVFDGWMNSEHHRDNILKADYREIGIGVARNAKGEVYYTQVFGAPPKE
jgi:uncharacterized protein YkwD